MDDGISKCQGKMVNSENMFVDIENLKLRAMTMYV